MTIYETNFKKLQNLIPLLRSYPVGAHSVSKSGGSMDLHFDVLGIYGNMHHIALAHNYQQNGDTLPDPDMELLVYFDMDMVEAFTYQDSFGYQEVYPQSILPEKKIINVKLKQQLNSFLRKWLMNLKRDGHKVLNENRTD